MNIWRLGGALIAASLVAAFLDAPGPLVAVLGFLGGFLPLLYEISASDRARRSLEEGKNNGND